MNCPHCNADLTGEVIPKQHRHNFGGATHFSRRIAVIADDRTVCYECPDCKGKWPRTDATTPGQFRTINARG